MLEKLIATLKELDKETKGKYLEIFQEDIKEYEGNLKTVLINWNDFVHIWQEDKEVAYLYKNLKKVINEYLEVLWCILVKNLNRKKFYKNSLQVHYNNI